MTPDRLSNEDSTNIGLVASSGKKRKASPLSEPSVAKDEWTAVSRNYYRCAKLGQYFDISFEPKISDVEVMVCFSDLRGFIAYCKKLQEKSLDSRIHNFLRAYFSIYGLAVLRHIWALEPDDPEAILSEEASQIRSIIVPKTYKNLGDGVMLVWEIPAGTPPVIQGKATHRVLLIINRIFQSFEKRFRNPGIVEVDAYSELVKKMRIGFGLARGHAWKLDFGSNLKPDYAGSVINLASRLQDLARPEGVVCQREFSQSLLDSLVAKKVAKMKDSGDLKGLGTDKIVFIGRGALEDSLSTSSARKRRSKPSPT